MQRCAAKMGAYISFAGVLNTDEKMASENFCSPVLHPDQKNPFHPSAQFIPSAT